MQLPQVLNCVSRHHSGTPSTSTFVGHWYLAPSKYTKPLSRESLDRSSDNSSVKQGPFNQASTSPEPRNSGVVCRHNIDRAGHLDGIPRPGCACGKLTYHHESTKSI